MLLHDSRKMGVARVQNRSDDVRAHSDSGPMETDRVSSCLARYMGIAEKQGGGAQGEAGRTHDRTMNFLELDHSKWDNFCLHVSVCCEGRAPLVRECELCHDQ